MERRPSSPGVAAGGESDFELYCDERQRGAAIMSRHTTADSGGGLEARFSPPQLAQTHDHTAAASGVVRPGSLTSSTDNDTQGPGATSLYSLSLFNTAAASDSSDFTCKSSDHDDDDNHRFMAQSPRY